MVAEEAPAAANAAPMEATVRAAIYARPSARCTSTTPPGRAPSHVMCINGVVVGEAPGSA